MKYEMQNKTPLPPIRKNLYADVTAGLQEGR